MAAKAKASPLTRLPIGKLVDRLGEMRARAAAVKAEEAEIKAEVLRRRVAEAEGERFRLVLVSATRWSLDSERLKAVIGQDEYNRLCRQQVVTSLRVTPCQEAVAALAAPAAA